MAMSKFKRLSIYIKPYWSKMALAMGTTLLLTLTNIPVPLLVKYLVDDVLAKGNWAGLNIVFFGIVLVFLVKGGLSFLLTYLITFLGQRLVLDLRRQIYRHLQRLSLSFYDRERTGKIISRIIDDVDLVQTLISNYIITIFTDVVTLGVILFIIFRMNWQLSLVCLSVLPFYVINYRMFIQKIKSASQRTREKMDEILGNLGEKLTGVSVIKAFGKEEHEIRLFQEQNLERFGLRMRQGVLNIYLSSTAGLISGLGTALALSFGGYQVFQGALTVGGLMAFYSYIGFLYNPAVRLSEVNSMIQQGVVSLNRIFEILDTMPDVEDKASVILPRIKGRVQFKNVYFGYSPDQFILKNINLDVHPGQLIALVGHTGSGKTTIVNLIPRFYDPILGSVLVDGYDIRKVQLNSLRQQIGIVLQESVLFDGTIADNIRYGKLTATQEEIEKAAKTANIHDFIVSLPEGYQTKVGKDGLKLSVGEKQRIAIARAVIADPAILIMDEATSSLDSESEAQIQEALQRIMKERTSFVIAHRLSTIIEADLIVVMDNGEIVEMGTHSELLAKGGLYSKYYEEQFKVTTTLT
ncbi:hypothetical protein B5M50_02550 [candidate division KSB1 bacterium 4484_219]|nr:ABC transporter ATP-binding protein [bacterium]OQX59580.1 MAG: hypothetical protein B5M50_02550 [candidate division KSB1 bacterium 4484_219]RKY89430.1 MAG: ABC transporter ATP-binding protein [candidate division KSB1 bacterium]